MASVNATDLKAGAAFLYEGKPFKVKKYTLIKMGRGGATVRVACINLENGANVEHAFSSNLSFEQVDLNKRQLQYLYKDNQNAFFMDPQNYEQIEVPLSILGDDHHYLKEGENAVVMFWNLPAQAGSRPMSVELPPKIVLEVVECDPGIKGNTVSNLYKSAKLSNGIETKVPLFIKQGEKVIIDTRTGDYVERFK
jgi:elongation factor P